MKGLHLVASVALCVAAVASAVDVTLSPTCSSSAVFTLPSFTSFPAVSLSLLGADPSVRFFGLFFPGPNPDVVITLTASPPSPDASLAISVLSSCDGSSTVIASASSSTAAPSAAVSLSFSLWQYGSAVVSVSSTVPGVVPLAVSHVQPVPGDSCETAISSAFMVLPAVVSGTTVLSRRSVIGSGPACESSSTALPRQGMWYSLPVGLYGSVVAHTCNASNAVDMTLELYRANCSSLCAVRASERMSTVPCRGGAVVTWVPDPTVPYLLFVTAGSSALLSGPFTIAVAFNGTSPNNTVCSSAEPIGAFTSGASPSVHPLVAVSGDSGPSAGFIPRSPGTCTASTVGPSAGLWYSVDYRSDGRFVTASVACTESDWLAPAQLAADIYMSCGSGFFAYGCVRAVSVYGTPTNRTASARWFAPQGNTTFLVFVRGCQGNFVLVFDEENSTDYGSLIVSPESHADISSGGHDAHHSSSFSSDSLSRSSASSNTRKRSTRKWLLGLIVAGSIAGAVAVSISVCCCVSAARRRRAESERNSRLSNLTMAFEDNLGDEDTDMQGLIHLRPRGASPFRSHRSLTPIEDTSCGIEESPSSAGGSAVLPNK